MSADVTIPEIGESITEGLLVEWSQADGAVVGVDDPLLVLETDKITMTVNAEASGRLEILVPEGETVEVGQVVGRLHEVSEDEAAQDASSSDDEAMAEEEPPEPEMESEPGKTDTETAESETKAEPTVAEGGRFSTESGPHLTPAVRRLVDEHDLDPSRIEGSGKGGRILKGDVLAELERSETPPEAESKSQKKPKASPKPEPPGKRAGERQTREPMSRLRRRAAERLVGVQQEAAILTTFNEVDMGRVMALRSQYRDEFEERHGVRLGFMSFFVKAAVDALKTVPRVNSFIDGEEVVTNHYYDIGIAVSSDKGLVVPVVRDADRLSLAEVEAAIADVARKAHERTLELSDLTGGVFTISNGGVFGSMLSTPILNPPQSAILGMHTIKKRPVVIDDEIVVRPVMYLALSYDHRLIDGAEAVTFLKRIVECIENPERMMLEV